MPRILDFLDQRNLSITVFVVGRDAERRNALKPLQAIVAAGHEIGNHSLNHYAWLRSLPPEQIEQEVVGGEKLIAEALGVHCRGFRAPGFSGSPVLNRTLIRCGYAYDASAFPTFLGPVARAYAALKTKQADAAPAAAPKPLFGSWRDGFAPLRPQTIEAAEGSLGEIPVTTMPILRLPFHMTYLLHLRQVLGPTWRVYLRTALALCRLRGVAPSMLLHPLDFLGCEDEPELAFLPGMKLPRDKKVELVGSTLEMIAQKLSAGAAVENGPLMPE